MFLFPAEENKYSSKRRSSRDRYVDDTYENYNGFDSRRASSPQQSIISRSSQMVKYIGPEGESDLDEAAPRRSRHRSRSSRADAELHEGRYAEYHSHKSRGRGSSRGRSSSRQNMSRQSNRSPSRSRRSSRSKSKPRQLPLSEAETTKGESSKLNPG